MGLSCSILAGNLTKDSLLPHIVSKKRKATSEALPANNRKKKKATPGEQCGSSRNPVGAPSGSIPRLSDTATGVGGTPGLVGDVGGNWGPSDADFDAHDGGDMDAAGVSTQDGPTSDVPFAIRGGGSEDVLQRRWGNTKPGPGAGVSSITEDSDEEDPNCDPVAGDDELSEEDPEEDMLDSVLPCRESFSVLDLPGERFTEDVMSIGRLSPLDRGLIS
jgi:hypothetical protein